jgi:hypothetical protein
MNDIGILEDNTHLLEIQKTGVSSREVRSAQMRRRCSESEMELVKVDIIAVYQYIEEKTDENLDCICPIAREL